MKMEEKRPYKQISLDIEPDEIIQPGHEVVSYGIEVDGGFQGVRYYECDVKHRSNFVHIIALGLGLVLTIVIVVFSRHRVRRIIFILLFFLILFVVLLRTLLGPRKYRTSNVTDQLLAKIPQEYRDQFMVPLYMHINGDITPHTDSGARTVLNVYLKAGGYETDFNVPKVDAVPFKIRNQSEGICYRFGDVDTICSFVAQDGDIFILDVSQLHSVHSGMEKDRIALVIGTNLPFDQVCMLFDKEGYFF